MAITLNSSPNSYQSFHEDLWFVVSSTNTAQPSFKYVFDVYINSTLVARVKSFPQPTSNKGIFNAATIVRNYWSSYFRTQSPATLFNDVSSDIRVAYTIQFGEEYSGTTYTNLTSSAKNSYNYYPSILDGATAFNGALYDDYKKSLLTTRDTLNIDTRLTGSNTFVSILNGVENTSKNWRFDVTRYNSGTGTTNTSGGNVAVTDFALLDVSPDAINEYLGSTFITSATDYYILESYYDSGAEWSMRVNVLCESRYTPISIHFLNSFGGYDTMNFTLVNRESRNVERKSFEKINWELSGSNMNRANGSGIFYGGSVPFATQQTITYKLTSDWLSLTDYNWLRDLITSPEVYMQDGDYFIPVKVNTNSWNEKKRYADKLYNIELDIEVGQIHSQYR